MKDKLSPGVIIGIIVALIVVIGVIVYSSISGERTKSEPITAEKSADIMRKSEAFMKESLSKVKAKSAGMKPGKAGQPGSCGRTPGK